MPIANTLNSMSMTESFPSPIEVAAKHQKWIFALYVCVLVVGAIAAAVFTVLVYRAGNKYQEAVRADAQSRIEGVKAKALADTTRVENEAKERIAKAASESQERITKVESVANEKIADANRRTAELKTQAEQLRKNNLETEKKLESERNDRLGIEKSLAARQLPIVIQNGKRNLDPLGAFAGTDVIMEYLPDAECARAASEILKVLDLVKWNIVEVRPRTDINQTFFDGVVIETTPVIPGTPPGDRSISEEQRAAHSSRVKAARALADFLTAANWQKARDLDAWTPRDGMTELEKQRALNVVRIIVGFKPNPYFNPDWQERFRKYEENLRKLNDPKK